MASNQYGLSMIELTGTGAAVIGQIAEVTLDPGLDDLIQSLSGDIDPTFSTVPEQNLKIRFKTTAIKVALDLIGIGGILIGGTVYSSINFYLRKRAPGGEYATGAASVYKIGCTSGLIVPIQTSGTQGAISDIEYELTPLSDGVNVPIALTAVAALPAAFTAAAAAVADAWTLGPWYIDGVLLESMREFTLDFGIELEQIRGNGIIWPTQVSIKQRRPQLQGKLYHLDMASDTVAAGNVSLLGKLSPSASVTRAFLKKKVQGGGNELDATALHIRFDISEGRLSITDLGATHPESAMMGLSIKPTKLSANAIVTVNTAAAIGIA